MAVCPSCGQENPEGFRLCGMCGTPLSAAPLPVRETRKVVTVVFSDVTGSTALGERLDPESLRRVMSRYFEAMRAVLERHGGTVEKFIGDAVMAVFGIPVVHEDDALRAVRAAAEMRERLAVLNRELEAGYGVTITSRVGVNTGEVMAGDPSRGQSFATGDAVNVAARLEQAAAGGEILLGAETYGLVRDAVRAEPVEPLELKGKSEAVAAFRLLEVVPGAAGHARRLDSPIVGRDRELRLLRDAFERAVQDRACQLFTVLGSAGVGKSRLVAEFLPSLRDATVASGRCLPYGEGITYWPVIEAVRQAVEIEDEDRAEEATRKLESLLSEESSAALVAHRVVEAMGLTAASATAEETAWALRRLFEALARQSPLVLVFDDLQWGEQTFLDLVEHVADWSRDAPILLLCMARPDLLDVRTGWGGGKLNATTVLLEPLDDGECGRLIANILGGAALTEEARGRIAAAAEGNPLFVEEMVGMLIDEGALRRENGHWRAVSELSSVPVPPTIRALLSARLDQLPAEERAVLEAAAVEGQVFHRGAVAELSPEPVRPALGASLMGLVRRELVRPERPAFSDEDAFRFRHLLIRDAAYDALPKEARAELHERFAAWLERKAEGRSAEFAELVGYHLEQASRYRRELSPTDAAADDLAARAGAQLADAGRRAFARGDMPGAANLLERAAPLLPRESSDRLELLPLLAASLVETRRLLDARATLAEAAELGRKTGNRRVEWRAVAADGWWRANVDEVPIEEIEALARRAIDELERLDDDFGLAYAWRLLGDVHNTRGDGAGWIEALQRGFEHARRAGNRHEEWACLMIFGGAMFFGPTPASEGIARLEEILAQVGDDLLLESAVSRALGGFHGIQGRLDEGWAMIERARSTFTELGLAWGLAGIPFMSGRIALLSGDAEKAEQEYRVAAASYAGMGERGRQSSILSELSEAVYAQGRYDEANQLAGASTRLADELDGPWSRARIVRAKVLARRGDLVEAERLARDALARAEATDWLDHQAIVLLDLTEVLELAGRPDEAVPLVERAIELCRQKENVLLERRAEEVLARLG